MNTLEVINIVAQANLGPMDKHDKVFFADAPEGTLIAWVLLPSNEDYVVLKTPDNLFEIHGADNQVWSFKVTQTC